MRCQRIANALTMHCQHVDNVLPTRWQCVANTLKMGFNALTTLQFIIADSKFLITPMEKIQRKKMRFETDVDSSMGSSAALCRIKRLVQWWRHGVDAMALTMYADADADADGQTRRCVGDVSNRFRCCMRDPNLSSPPPSPPPPPTEKYKLLKTRYSILEDASLDIWLDER